MRRETPEQQRERRQNKLKASGKELIKCPECGKMFIRLGGHAVQTHGYPNASAFYFEYGMTRKEGSNAEYKALMRKYTKSNGTEANLIKGIERRYKPNDGHAQKVSAYWENRRKKRGT